MSAICGGVIKESLFFRYPSMYQMNLYMKDKKFDKWVKMKPGKEKDKYFEDNHYSAI